MRTIRQMSSSKFEKTSVILTYVVPSIQKYAQLFILYKMHCAFLPCYCFSNVQSYEKYVYIWQLIEEVSFLPPYGLYSKDPLKKIIQALNASAN